MTAKPKYTDTNVEAQLAAGNLVHYFKRAGVCITADVREEIREIIGCTIEAAVAKVKAEDDRRASLVRAAEKVAKPNDYMIFVDMVGDGEPLEICGNSKQIDGIVALIRLSHDFDSTRNCWVPFAEKEEATE